MRAILALRHTVERGDVSKITGLHEVTLQDVLVTIYFALSVH